jgi:hypothetical protein
MPSCMEMKIARRIASPQKREDWAGICDTKGKGSRGNNMIIGRDAKRIKGIIPVSMKRLGD